MSEHEDKSHGGGGGSHGRGGGHGGHGGGGGAHEEHEGAPEWLISFADNVALMMGFFVVLLAMNMKEPTTGGIGGKEQHPSETRPEFLDAIIEIRRAFRNEVDPNSASPREQVLVKRLKERLREGETSTPGPDGQHRDQQSLRPTEFEAPCASVAFDDDSAVLSAEAREIVAAAAGELAGYRYVVDVRGNVSAAEASRTEDRGMLLSYQRALAVARVLEANGLHWRQLRVVAGGDTWRMTPRALNTAGHRSNQRTELYRTDDIMPSDPYAVDLSAKADEHR